MKFDQTVLISAGDMSGNLTSNGIDLQQLGMGAIQAVWTGAPTGTLILQVSCDIVLASLGTNPSANVTHWSDYTSTSQALTGSAGDFTWNFYPSGYRWIRLKYTFTSGSGALTATFNGKG